MKNKLGQRTLRFTNPISISSFATIAGRKEQQGPLGELFDHIFTTNLHDEDSWEKAEQKLQQYAIEIALEKGNLTSQQLDYFIGGDLLNQIIATSFTARAMGVPYFGLYGACSSLVESFILASCLIDGGFADTIGVCTSSHHDTAERQLRYPTEMGVQRTMTAQWTVTGSGAYILDNSASPINITHGIPGKIVDSGIKNNMDMGTAMASAAADTIKAYLNDAQGVNSVDCIVTGDLGQIGQEICSHLLLNQGYDIRDKYLDCGNLIYDTSQDVHAGGSGCGCSAVVLGAYFLPKMLSGSYKRLLLVGTGALLSPTSTQQGESIPCIAHGVVIETLDQH